MNAVRALVVVAVAAWLTSTAHAQSADAVWDAITLPGSVVVVRHSYAPGGFDPPDSKLEDCSTQRNLDESGRAQAARIGEAFKRRGITVGEVLSSPRCLYQGPVPRANMNADGHRRLPSADKGLCRLRSISGSLRAPVARTPVERDRAAREPSGQGRNSRRRRYGVAP